MLDDNDLIDGIDGLINIGGTTTVSSRGNSARDVVTTEGISGENVTVVIVSTGILGEHDSRGILGEHDSRGMLGEYVSTGMLGEHVSTGIVVNKDVSDESISVNEVFAKQDFKGVVLTVSVFVFTICCIF